ncbi:MAG TPA: hypothetical protein VNF69_13935 [Burkholderiales bacterium]|nr:hypothetical protein [Burkholderiales bacterium]
MTQEDVLSTFDFHSGTLRGARFALYPARLVYHAGTCIESIQLGAVGAVRVAFEREGRKLGWAVVLALLALVLFLVSGPLAAWGNGAAADVLQQMRQGSSGAGHGVGTILLSMLHALTQVAELLPVAAVLLGAWALAWAILGWIGFTMLTLIVGPVERTYAVRGRNTRMIDFSEAISACVSQLRR